jgi:LmbE family N-acetylglucosaminyl deacetylase
MDRGRPRFIVLLTITLVWVVGIAGWTQVPAPDRGAAGVWQKLRKLQTTASAMHTTAHPDDEHGGMLALLSRGLGARVSLLTLTRGESGDNAIGSELFDALGLIRTEELLVADRYYGVDAQYFTSVADYGFSKRLDEALEKWGREHVLRDMVRIIRTDRPMVVISRFQGNPRDGHGNHEAAGLLTRDAFRMAGDAKAFADQASGGLRPWQPLKLYMGGVRENEDWNVRLDTGTYDPVLGESYQGVARLGLSFQRSQNSGRFVSPVGPSASYYRRLETAPGIEAPAQEQSFFDGIDTTIPGLYRTLGHTAPPAVARALATVDGSVKDAIAAFTLTDPSAAVPALAKALAAVTTAIVQENEHLVVRAALVEKKRQIADAIHAALGVTLTGMAQPEGVSQAGPFGAGAVPMPPVVPGQVFNVRATFVNPSSIEIKRVHVFLEEKLEGKLEGKDIRVTGDGSMAMEVGRNQPMLRTFTTSLGDAHLTRPHFTRPSIQDARYTVADSSTMPLPALAPALEIIARYEVAGVQVEIRRPVMRLESNLPYGYDERALAVVPAIAVSLSPSSAIVAIDAPQKTVTLRAEVLNNREGKSDGVLTLKVPPGWTVSPAAQPFALTRAGERALYEFQVGAPTIDDRVARIEAVAQSGGREYREGYTTIRHRDLETRYLYKDAVTTVRRVDVRIAPGLRVGYVMGVGDDVPAGIAQLGATVELLGEQDLATGDLTRFDAIVTGTRAYAVRSDLRTYNRRLLDYVEAGGHLIVLYNTQELVPTLYAPFPGELPANAEEVSEEDSPVEFLSADAAVLTTPNRITRDDFSGWVEQRGSKFWTTWDPRYTAMIATWDKGQTPQRGGWLQARYGKGHYTYFAYAFHRQLPYGVPGAYRLLANLLSIGR